MPSFHKKQENDMARKMKSGIGRRGLLKGAAGVAGAVVGSGAVTGFPVI